VEEARSGLPIIGMEQEIVEAIAENDVVVLCGETGCGKTTQVCTSYTPPQPCRRVDLDKETLSKRMSLFLGFVSLPPQALGFCDTCIKGFAQDPLSCVA
jgi:hypothetical protein